MISQPRLLLRAKKKKAGPRQRRAGGRGDGKGVGISWKESDEEEEEKEMTDKMRADGGGKRLKWGKWNLNETEYVDMAWQKHCGF